MEELPCELDTLINFRNLSITIEFLYKNNIKLNEKVNDITARLNQLLDIKEDVENLKIKSESTQNRINLLQDSVNHFSDTLLKYEERFTQMNDKLNSYDTTIEFVKNATEDNMKKVMSHEDNLNNLNRVVEDQIKSLEKEKGNIENNRLEIEKLKELINNYDNEINKLDTKIIESNNKLTESLNEVSNKSIENINIINGKIKDLSSNISSLADNVNQLNNKTGIQNQVEIKEIKETPKIENQPIKIEKLEKVEKIDNTNIEGDTIINSTNDNTIINRNLQRKISNPLNKIEHIPIPDEIPDELNKDDIDFIYNKIKSFDKINQATKVHYDKELNLLNQKLTQLQNLIKKPKIDTFDNIPPITNNISMIEEPSTIPEININKGTDEVLKKVSETLRMFSNSIENKAPMKKLDELNSNVDKKLKALGDKFQNAINILENKYKLGNQNNNNIKNEGENNNFDYDILVQNINVEIMKKVEDNIKDMVQNKMDQFDLTSNPNIENLNKILEEHKDELDKAFESIVDIRNNLLSKKVQDDLTGLLKKVEASDEKNRKLRFDIEKITKLLEGETEENKEGESNNKFQGSFRDNINFLGQKIAELQNNYNELKSKVENMNKEILTIVKRDLKNESQRILEEFKSDLRLSISKIEEQLRDKVDKFGLAEFGQKMNSRIGNEMSRKIDKNDMSKNNMYISRKIDNLENKISRTLVDTLIDLQLDEAPLMTKKNLMGNVEKCASCNQPLPQNQGYYMVNKSIDFNNYGNRNSGFKSKYVIKESEKLPEIK